MKVKRPKTISLGGLKYKIHYVKSGSVKELGKKESGAIDQHSMQIWVDSEGGDQIQLLTIMHEILHGIAFILYPTKGHVYRENFASQVSELLVQALQSGNMYPEKFLNGD